MPDAYSIDVCLLAMKKLLRNPPRETWETWDAFAGCSVAHQESDMSYFMRLLREASLEIHNKQSRD